METQEERLIKHLRREMAIVIGERARQKEMLGRNLARLQNVLDEMTDLHVSVLEQMSVTNELITDIRNSYDLPSK